jgi:hypothetical protein
VSAFCCARPAASVARWYIKLQQSLLFGDFEHLQGFEVVPSFFALPILNLTISKTPQKTQDKRRPKSGEIDMSTSMVSPLQANFV